jgi:hypothetical protein
MRKKLLVLFSLVSTCYSYGQQEANASALVINSQGNFNLSQLDPGDPLFNGKQHLGYAYTIQGIAYYKTAEWQKGSLVYRGVLYPDLFMKYDLVQDQVIVRHPNGYTMVALFTPRVQSFSFLNADFVYLADTSFHVPTGIYQEVSKGSLAFYIRHVKIIDEKVGQWRVEQTLLDHNQYYIKKNGRFFPIYKQRELMNLVKQQRTEIRNYLRKQGVKFRRDPEKAIRLVVDYYNNKTGH